MATADPRAGLAAYYDLSATFPDDVAFYLSRLPSSKCNVLELGCGTGRVSVSLAQNAGFFVGVDHSAEMAAVCEQRLATAGLGATSSIVVGDITELELPHRFHLIVAPFRVLQNLESDAEVDALLRGVAEHLLPDGRCILNAFRPSRSPEELIELWHTPDESRVWEAETAEGTVVRFDRRAGCRESPLILHPDLIYRTYRDGHMVREVVHSIAMRCYYPDELLRLVRRHGFVITERWGGYHGEKYGEGPELVVEFGVEA